jgi:hypothetical protein
MPFPYGTTLAVAGLGQLYYARSRIDGMRRIMEYDPLSKPIMLWNARTGKLLRQIDTGWHVVSRSAAISWFPRALMTTALVWALAGSK